MDSENMTDKLINKLHDLKSDDKLYLNIEETNNNYDNNFSVNEMILLNTVLTSTDPVIIIRHSDGMFLYANEAFTQIIGYPDNDLLGKTSDKLNIWADRDIYIKLLKQVESKRIVKDFEIRLISCEGKAILKIISASLIELNGINVVLIISCGEILQNKSGNDALNEKYMFDALMNNLSDHVYFMDRESKFICNNLAHANSFGLNDPRKLIGKSDFDFFTEHAASEAYNDDQLIMHTGRPIIKEEKLTRKNCKDVWFSALKMPLCDNKGNIIGTFGISRDITEKKNTEETLKMEQFLFNALMNNLSDHVYFKDLESKFIRNNLAHTLSFGLDDPIKLIGKSDFDFFTEEAARSAYEDEQSMIKSGFPIIKEEKLTRRDSSDVWFSVIKMPLRDTNGNIIGTFGISRDITVRKKTEEALKHSEEKFRSIAQSAHDAIITTNSKDEITGWNKGAENIFQYLETEITGQLLSTIINYDLQLMPFKKLENSGISEGENIIGKTAELTGMRKNGVSFPVELSISKWETSEGLFFTSIIRDISQRKRTELENHILYEIMQGVTTTANLDELIRLIHLSISEVVYAENFFVALYNQKSGLFSFPYFVDKLDLPPLPIAMKKSCSAYVFRTVKPLLLTQSKFNQLVTQDEVELVGSNSPSWIGIPLQTPSRVIGVLVLQHYETGNVYSENDVKFLMSIGSQIAIAIDRRMSEEEIRLKNELLQTINAEKDKFFSIIAHDLRGPLSSFVAATQIISEEIQTMGIEEIKEITGYMKKSATNIYSLLENLLEWSRLKRGGIDFVPVTFNAEERLNVCIDLLNESSKRKGIDIKVHIPVGLKVKADKNMFDTLVRNLLSNAVKFTNPKGQINVLASRNSENSVEFEIRDSGIGMSPELRDKLFQIDVKTNRLGTEGEPSTGLGLLLCKEFVEKHGGKIWVESNVGEGSSFHFILPDNP